MLVFTRFSAHRSRRKRKKLDLVRTSTYGEIVNDRGFVCSRIKELIYQLGSVPVLENSAMDVAKNVKR